MNTLKAIAHRRSIRSYGKRDISREDIEKILEAARQAPSGKNRQPWKFIVVRGSQKEEMLRVMDGGIENEKAGKGLLLESTQFTAGAKHTMQIMEKAPVTVFIINTLASQETILNGRSSAEDRLYDLVNIQSIGAAVQNMLLAADDMGIGSLWICNIFFAWRELTEWLHTDGELIAAVSFGYAEEKPNARPRKETAEIVEWRE